jgi:hypothetical protein
MDLFEGLGEQRENKGSLLERHGQLLEKLVRGQAALFEELNRVNHFINRQEKLEERLGRLEDKVFRN